MKIFIFLTLITLAFFVTANGNYDIHKKYSFEIKTQNGIFAFTKFKARLSGKLSGYIKNNSPFHIKWVWFDFERFDKNGVKTTVSKSYPQLLFEDIPSWTQKKIKDVSMVGVKWLKSFNFGEIIGIEYGKEFYIQYAKKLMTPILIKTIGLKYNKRLFKNEINLNWINSGDPISKISFHFEGVNKRGDQIKIEPILSFSNIDGINENEEITDIWSSWDNPDISCPMLNSVEIIYLNGKTLELKESNLKKLIYSPLDELYPSQSIEILNCMKQKLYI